MDIPMGADLYESFVNYQTRLIGQFDHLAREYAFDTIDATQPVDDIHDYLSAKVTALLEAGERRRASV